MTRSSRRVTPGFHPSTSGRPAVAALFATLAVALLVPATALAHAQLVSSDPADGAAIATFPASITLTFDDRLVAGRSYFEVIGPAGSVGRGDVDPQRPRRLVFRAPAVPSGTVPAGAYEIRWRAISDDGHNELERGIVRFTVTGATPSAETPLPPTATPGGTNEPATPPASTGPTEPPRATPEAPTPSPVPAEPSPAASTGDVVLPIVAALLVVVAVGGYVLRRSRRA